MERTNNYDFKLYEGTDKFNPLLFENENMEIIDGAMYALQGLSIESATELKSGSVHAVTRLNGESPLFRFTATSNWTAGDTMTIDGAQVSVFTPSGEGLGTGSYVIGTEVIGAVIGTRVTLYVTSGAVAIAEDSEKLGGQLPDYYATRVQNELAMQTATAAGTLSEQNQQQINEINQKLSSSRTLLWSNPNRTIAFNQQTITIEQQLNDFDEIEIIATTTTSSTGCMKEQCNKTLPTARINALSYGNSFGSSVLFRRDVSVNFNANTITIDNGVSTGSSAATNNGICIPVQIYGIKYL